MLWMTVTAIDRKSLDICRYLPQTLSMLNVVFVTIGPDCLSLHFFLLTLA